jgi:hypothetical protein
MVQNMCNPRSLARKCFVCSLFLVYVWFYGQFTEFMRLNLNAMQKTEQDEQRWRKKVLGGCRPAERQETSRGEQGPSEYLRSVLNTGEYQIAITDRKESVRGLGKLSKVDSGDRKNYEYRKTGWGKACTYEG